MMQDAVLTQIEERFSQLSLTEQLWLIERLVHYLHQRILNKESRLEQQLAVMAADPEIQGELRKIEEQLVLLEVDGLEPV